MPLAHRLLYNILFFPYYNSYLRILQAKLALILLFPLKKHFLCILIMGHLFEMWLLDEKEANLSVYRREIKAAIFRQYIFMGKV